MRWDTEAETTLLQVRNPKGVITDYKIKSNFYEVPIPIPGAYFWRIKAISATSESDFSEWALVKATDSILEMGRPLMAEPLNNTVLPFQTDTVDVNFSFTKPKLEWEYYVEVFQDEQKLFGKMALQNTFKLTFPKTAKEIRWRVVARSKFGNVSREAVFWKLKLEYKPVMVKFKIEAAGKKDQATLKWPPQDGCPSYRVFLEDAQFGETAKTEFLIPLSVEQKTVRVECANNKNNYGLLGVKKREVVVAKSPKKVQAKYSRFYYQFALSQFTISQNITGVEIDPSSFENSYLLQSHLVGWDYRWGEKYKYNIIPYARYAKTLSFSDEITVLSFGALAKYAAFKDKTKKLLAELNITQIEYEFLPGAVLAQAINVIGLGYEAPVRMISPKLTMAGLVKLTVSTTTPSFEVRANYRHNRKFQFHLGALRSVSDFNATTNGETGNAQTTILQLEAGATYFFK